MSDTSENLPPIPNIWDDGSKSNDHGTPIKVPPATSLDQREVVYDRTWSPLPRSEEVNTEACERPLDRNEMDSAKIEKPEDTSQQPLQQQHPKQQLSEPPKLGLPAVPVVPAQPLLPPGFAPIVMDPRQAVLRYNELLQYMSSAQQNYEIQVATSFKTISELQSLPQEKIDADKIKGEEIKMAGLQAHFQTLFHQIQAEMSVLQPYIMMSSVMLPHPVSRPVVGNGVIPTSAISSFEGQSLIANGDALVANDSSGTGHSKEFLHDVQHEAQPNIDTTSQAAELSSNSSIGTDSPRHAPVSEEKIPAEVEETAPVHVVQQDTCNYGNQKQMATASHGSDESCLNNSASLSWHQLIESDGIDHVNSGKKDGNGQTKASDKSGQSFDDKYSNGESKGESTESKSVTMTNAWKPPPGRSTGVWGCAVSGDRQNVNKIDFPVLAEKEDSKKGTWKTKPSVAGSALDAQDFPSLSATSAMSKKEVKTIQKAEEEKQIRVAGPVRGRPERRVEMGQTHPASARVRHGSGGQVRVIGGRIRRDSSRSSTGSPCPSTSHHGMARETFSPSLERCISVHVEAVNDIASQFILAVSQQGQCVFLGDIKQRILQQFGVHNFRELGIVRPEDEISCLKKLVWRQSKVNAYLSAYDYVCRFGTLLDLDKELVCAVDDSKTNFEELHLGPLIMQPKVRNLFCLPKGATKLPLVPTSELLRHLQVFMGRNRGFVNQGDFMRYLCKQYNCPTLGHLGIRLKNIALAIQVIHTAERRWKEQQPAYMAIVEQDLIAMFDDSINKMKRELSHKIDLEESNSSARFAKKYADMDAVSVVCDVFQMCTQFFEIDPVTRNIFLTFLTKISQSALASKMFHVAVSLGQIGDPEQLFAEASTGHASQGEMSRQMSFDGSGDGAGQAPPRPTTDAILKALENLMESTQCTMSLGMLSKVEQHLVQEFQFNSFADMGHGPFLHFILENIQFLEDYCGSTFAVHGYPGTRRASYQPARDEILTFLVQCGIHERSDKELEPLDCAVCQHYAVTSVRDLGHGSLAKLMQALQKDKQAQREARDSNVKYALAATAQAGGSTQGPRSTGLLGAQSLQLALCSLASVPLLSDMAAWTHWDLVFKPQHGDLKTFILNHGGIVTNLDEGTSDVCALETKPGTLLHITQDTSTQQFQSAVERQDVTETAGHLVSLVILDCGVHRAPLDLLASHVEAALRARVSLSVIDAEIPSGGETDGFQKPDDVVKYVKQCILCVPVAIGQHVVRKVFLDPLGKLLGNTRSRELLWNCCIGEEQHYLEALGLLLGINEWTAELLDRLTNKADRARQQGQEQLLNLFDDEEADSSCETEESTDERPPGDGEDSPVNSESEIVLAPHDEKVVVKSDSLSETPNSSLTTGKKLLSITGDTTEETKGDKDCEEKEIGDSSESACLAIVNNIRRKKFGIGVDLPEEAQQFTDELKKTLGQSVERLSKELYNRNTHFVLELIQNADDNSYPVDKWEQGHSKEHPALVLVVERDCFTLLNNECGFSDKNIEALCTVGKSTKKKHKKGYIGQKGIGFKSVFIVTNRPEIHSNGYHIRFDATSDRTGYILPHWLPVDDRAALPDSSIKGLDLCHPRWTTRIVLPLKDETEKERQESMSMTASFHDVHPSLLLFLNRLKAISVVNKVTSETLVIRRQDVNEDITEITHGNKVDRWMLVRREVDIPEKLRPRVDFGVEDATEVESTELALAFPMQNQENHSTQKLVKQEVFAFLPLRSFGFKFIVQADFEIPSSRQDVLHDSRWNQWLRKEIPSLFVEALTKFKEQPGFTDVSAVCTYLQFVPTEGEVLDFFQPVAAEISRLLASHNCLPVQTKDGALEWRNPREVILCKYAMLRKVLPPSDLHHHLGRYYLHHEALDNISEPLLAALGVRELTAAELVDVFQAKVHETSQAGKGWDVQSMARWLVCVKHYLGTGLLDHHETQLSKLCELPIIPLAAGKWIHVKGNIVFFPLKMASFQGRGSATVDSTLRTVQQDLDTIHPDLLTCLSEADTTNLRRLLEAMGVKQVTTEEVIERHVLPILENEEARKEKSNQVLVAYLGYIRLQWERLPRSVDMSRLRQVAFVLTNRGVVNLRQNPVHFSPRYNNPINLSKDFPDMPWILLDPVYVANGDVKAWRKFFSALGVSDFLRVTKVPKILKPDEWIESQWADCKEKLLASQESYHIEDWECEEFEQLVSRTTDGSQGGPVPYKAHHQLLKLFELLTDRWVNQYSSAAKATVCDEKGQRLFEVWSTFMLKLKQLYWIPATYSEIYQEPRNQALKERLIPVAQAPHLVYLPTEDIKKRLGIHGAYLATPRMPPQQSWGFIEALGLRQSLDLGNFLQILTRWFEGQGGDVGCRDSGTVNSFCTSVEHMKNVLKYLEVSMKTEDLRVFIRSKRAIFVPTSTVEVGNQHTGQLDSRLQFGYFYQCDQVCWEDPSGMVGKYMTETEEGYVPLPGQRVTLHQHYGNMEPFFRDIIEVQRSPTLDEYTHLLGHVTSQIVLPDRLGLVDVFRIYEILGHHCILEKAMKIPGKKFLPKDLPSLELDATKMGLLKELVKDWPVFPTMDSKWVTLADRPLLVDSADKNLMDLFSSSSQRSCLNLLADVSSNSDIENEVANEVNLNVFYQAVGLQRLSDCVEEEAVAQNSRPCPALQQHVSDMVPYIQLFMRSRKAYSALYQDLQARRIGSTLVMLKFFQVGSLEMVYRICHVSPPIVIARKEKCSLQISPCEFYIQHEHLHATHEINRQLVRLFTSDSEQQLDLTNFLRMVQSHLQDGYPPTLEDFIREQQLLQLSPGEIGWYVPAPPVASTPTLGAEDNLDVAQKQVPDDLNWTDEDEAKRNRNKHRRPDAGPIEAWPPNKPDQNPALPRKDHANRPLETVASFTGDFKENTAAAEADTASQQEMQGKKSSKKADDGSKYSDDNEKTCNESTENKDENRSPTPAVTKNEMSGNGLGERNEENPTVPSLGADRKVPHSSQKEIMSEHLPKQQNYLHTHDLSGHADTVAHPHHHNAPMKESREYSDEVRHGGASNSKDFQGARISENGCSTKKATRHMSAKDWLQIAPASITPSTIVNRPQEISIESLKFEDVQGYQSVVPADLVFQEVPGNGEQSRLVGQWGEQWVFGYLSQKYQEQIAANQIKITWMNRDGETEAPFDIKVDTLGQKKNKTLCIEVKSTRSEDKEMFEIGSSEVEMALEMGRSYHLYRVYNVGRLDSSIKLRILKNVAELLHSKVVTLCMLI